jgi:hypothetical protein
MRMGVDGAGAALDAEGDRRFDAKVARARETVRAAGIEQALYEGLLQALGYGGNAPPMLALARLLPWRRLAEGVAPEDRALEFEARLLGAAGLLPSQRGHRGPVEAHVDDLERRFAAGGAAVVAARDVEALGRASENASRRVAAAARFLARLESPARLLAIVRAGTVNEAIARSSSRVRFWLRHHDVCAAPCRLPPALAGRSRALEIIVNVVLPVVCASGDAALRGGRARTLRAAAAAGGLRRDALHRAGAGVGGCAWSTRAAQGCWRCIATGAGATAAAGAGSVRL